MSKTDSERPILVVGPPRSGTSLVTGLLHLCGAWVGHTGRGANPKGSYENLYLRDHVTQQILRSCGADGEGLKEWPQWSQVEQQDIGMVRGPVAQALQEQDYSGGVWAFKDPKTTLIWDVWHRAYPNAKWIICERPLQHMLESAKKYYRGIDPAHVEKAMRVYDERARDLHVKMGPNARLVKPDPILEGSWDDFSPVVEWCGLAPLGPKNQAVCSFVEPALWHHKNQDEFGILHEQVAGRTLIAAGNGTKSTLFLTEQWVRDHPDIAVFGCNLMAEEVPLDAVFAIDGGPVKYLFEHKGCKATWIVADQVRRNKMKGVAIPDNALFLEPRRWKRSTGTFMFSVAIRCKPRRIILCGFDGEHDTTNRHQGKQFYKGGPGNTARHTVWIQYMLNDYKNLPNPPELWRVENDHESIMDEVAAKVIPWTAIQ